MTNQTMQDLKIKLQNHTEFQKARDAFLALSYFWEGDIEPYSAPYIYTYSDGRMLVDYFDSENKALEYFQNHKNLEITLDDLLSRVGIDEYKMQREYLSLLNEERPLFEKNYIENGGSLQFLKWEDCHDGTGSYQIDRNEVDNAEISSEDDDFEIEIELHAQHVTSCLFSWIQCAKTKAIPQGYYLMPIQPCKDMIEMARSEFSGLDIDDIDDRIVFAHQAMIQVLSLSKK